ncbi:hypothetical protein CEXT_487381 [Caerostris extrusa]|uniref:Uncharacterized protein n=1 Tax=Caerostris extrusa TaxID=172846 RepID=A0AAV4X488_CAEEX|nr:hypothetical protein CEXT_487381 [Caerostris extrusa]
MQEVEKMQPENILPTVKDDIALDTEMRCELLQDKTDVPERLHNRALWIVTGAVKTTPVAALKPYIMNPPIYEVIQKQTVSSFIRMKSSQKQKADREK